MKDVILAAEAARADAEAIAQGTPSVLLMERAAKAIYDLHDWTGKTAVVCGTGNNGGDGYALAEILYKERKSVTVLFAASPRTGDARYFYARCEGCGITPVQYQSGMLAGYDTIVDCLFGVGLTRPSEGVYAAIIQEINCSGAFVISADLPSGLAADSGLGDLCVQADQTITFAALKAGLRLNNGIDHAGKVCVCEIGTNPIPAAYLVERDDFADVITSRKRNSNKGNYGTVALLGGCKEYAGAIKLAGLALSALRAGCGIARLCVSDSIVGAVAPFLLESTLCSLPDEDGHMLFDPISIERALAGTRAAAVGMGWGSGAHNQEILSHILRTYTGTLILDADGLNALARMQNDGLADAACRVLLTPHPGEFARLCGKTIPEILSDPMGTAQEYARTYGVTVLLKGCTTVITDGRQTYLCDRGCAGMATAGSGDVLSGVLCGLFGYSEASVPLTAACGAYVAGCAAELAEEEQTAVSMIASDTVSRLPQAFRMI